MNDLTTELAIFNSLRAQLAEAEGMDADDEFVVGSIEGITSLPEAIAEIIRSARADDARVDALGKMIDELSERLSRYKQRSASKRAKACWAMAEAGMKKLEEPDFTVSLRNNPAGYTFLCEPAEAPEKFVTQKITYSWNRAAIKEADEQEIQSFARKTNGGQSISIRTR